MHATHQVLNVPCPVSPPLQQHHTSQQQGSFILFACMICPISQLQRLDDPTCRPFCFRHSFQLDASVFAIVARVPPSRRRSAARFSSRQSPRPGANSLGRTPLLGSPVQAHV